mmetsp:Transcript_14244/g.29068  ORF Transcript_14244/g.29068 Transcript_14244/m.29068 type:complete len:463 (-) Transcript_14244:4524-5912(-)
MNDAVLLPLELLRGLVDGREGGGEELSNAGLDLVSSEIHVDDEALSDGGEGFLGPGLEPVNGSAVDESGELEAAVPEGVPDGRAAEHHVQVLANLRDEVLIKASRVEGGTGGLGLGDAVIADGVKLILGVEVGDLTRGEKVVHVHKELLVDDLVVGEEPHDALLLHSGEAVHGLDVGLKVVDAVSRGDGNGLGLETADVGGQAGEGLLSASSDSDEHTVSGGVVDDTSDAADVPHGVLKQHKVHNGICLVVVLKGSVEGLLKRLDGLDLVIDRILPEAVHKVGVEEGLGVVTDELVKLEGGHGHLGLLLDQDLEGLLVLRGDKAVSVHALTLVQPQESHLLGRLDAQGGRHEQASEDGGDVAKVEHIVEVGGGLAEGRSDGVVHLERSLDDVLGHVHDVLLEAIRLKVAHKEGGENGHDGRFVRGRDAEGCEPALEAGVDEERTGGGVHGRHVLTVADGLLR